MDLSRLLPKSRYQTMNSEQKMHFVNRDGESYWVPAEHDQKITGVRHWEQAFRVYAAIYCKAHPERSPEIWQYVYVINYAAGVYSWENVANYDFTFRQLMAERPWRSWAKMYHQVWNVAMCELLSKNFQNLAGSSAKEKNNWRDRCCWRFNRGEKCWKWKCHFDHRCKVCGSFDHPSIHCTKKSKNREGNDKSSSANRSDSSHKATK